MNNDRQSKVGNRKLKYGSLSAAFGIVVVVLCITVNLVFSGLSAKWDLRVDITDDRAKYFTVSETTKKELNDYFEDTPDWHIDIRFLALEEDVSDVKILELARSYESAFHGHISLSFTDIDNDPVFKEKYEQLTQTDLTATHVIVEGANHVRAMTFTNFYYYDTESKEAVYFRGENTYTAAIMRAGLTSPPVAVFTAGHGECFDNNAALPVSSLVDATEEELAQFSSAIPLIGSLNDMGFAVQAVDLNQTDSLPDNTRLIIVLDPEYDFAGYDPENPTALNEIDIIRKKLEGFDCSLLVAVDRDTAELPNLSELLEENYGINYVSGSAVLDNTSSIKGSDGRKILGSLPPATDYSLQQAILSGFSGNERFVFPDAVQLTVSKRADITGEGALMNSSPDATVGGVAGTYPIFAFNMTAKAITNEQTGSDTEVYRYQTAYLLGSTQFLGNKCLNSGYANRALLESILRKANTVNNYSNVEPIEIVSEGLELTTGQARLWTVVVTCLAPLVIFGVAAVVWLKRRHS